MTRMTTRPRAKPRAKAVTAAPSPSTDIEDLVSPSAVPEHEAGDGAEAARISIEVRHATEFHDLDMKALRAVREGLLVWYDANRRKLPWRGDPPPYLTTATHTQKKKTGDVKQRKGSSMDAFVVAVQHNPEDDKKPVKSEMDSEGNSTLLDPPAAPRKVTPYETWVSEIMLQQTRVDTVVEYFTRWIDKFPTVAALAAASEEDVNALWAGLGYYRRARMLHAGAKYVMDNLNGELPLTVDGLLAIPGIGPYTAGAIASIAFGHQAPLVDGNVIRVIARLRAVGADPKNKDLIKFAWKAAGDLVEECGRPGALNQAIMELGATVCTVQVRNYLVLGDLVCPAKSTCLAYEEAHTPVTSWSRGQTPHPESTSHSCSICDLTRVAEWDSSTSEVTRFPLKAKKNESRNEVLSVTVVSCPTTTSSSDDPSTWNFLMSRRPADGLLAGQWEFLHSKIRDGDKVPPFAQRKKFMAARLQRLLGPQALAKPNVVHRRDLGELSHIFSHVKHHMGVEHLHLAAQPDHQSPTAEGDDDDDKQERPLRWMTVQEMQTQGITTGVKKILRLALQHRDAGPSSSLATIPPKRRRGSASHVAGAKRAKGIAQFFTKL